MKYRSRPRGIKAYCSSCGIEFINLHRTGEAVCPKCWQVIEREPRERFIVWVKEADGWRPLKPQPEQAARSMAYRLENEGREVRVVPAPSRDAVHEGDA